MATGITKRHSSGCKGRGGGRCNCNAGYEASVFSKREGKKIRKTFAREAEAKSWRADAVGAVEKGALRPTKARTVQQAWDDWKEGASAGTILNRSGGTYKPSALRGYEKGMRLYLLPKFEDTQLVDLTLPRLQDFVEEMIGKGFAASTIQVTLLPLRAIYKRAIRRGEVAINPCAGLELPAITGRRERFATPTEAEALIAAAPEQDRALWATAFYGGLRRGELMALRWKDVSLSEGVIDVRRGWDEKEGEIALKSRAGRRRVPIIPILRQQLVDLKLDGPDEDALVFGRTASTPFDPDAIRLRADKVWKAAKLNRISPHECRHTYASLMIAAGVNAKALSSFMGHANISVTMDRYGHLMPGSEAEAGKLLAAYLEAQRKAAEDAAREAEPCGTGAPAGAPQADLAL
jgi:integrase